MGMTYAVQCKRGIQIPAIELKIVERVEDDEVFVGEVGQWPLVFVLHRVSLVAVGTTRY